MKSRLLFLTGWLSSTLAAHGQAVGTSQAATAEQRLAEDLGVDRLRNALQPTAETRNTTLLLQSGVGNSGTINQVSLSGPANQAAIVQSGNGNTLSLDQLGTGNQTSFSQTGDANQAAIRQSGTTNTIVSRLAGNSNNVNVEQSGTGNQYSSQIIGNQGVYKIDQVGNYNTLTQRETSTATPLPGYEVKMEGNNMHLTIEQGKVFP